VDQAIKDVAASLSETNPTLGAFVETLGALTIASIEVGSTLPSTLKQVGEAFNDNILDKEWGDSLWTLPYYAVKNGAGFVGDVAKGNPELNEQIANLPPELQDEAKLVNNLVKGGVVLVAGGAIV